jgi:hypothetical protein
MSSFAHRLRLVALPKNSMRLLAMYRPSGVGKAELVTTIQIQLNRKEDSVQVGN